MDSNDGLCLARTARSCLAIVLCATLSGCYARTETDNDIVFRVAWWPPLLVIAGGLAAIGLGVLLMRHKHPYRGVALCALALVILIGWAPGMYLEKVVVTPTEVLSTHGLLWNREQHRIVFADVAEVTARKTESMARFRPREHFSLVCRLHDERIITVPLVDLMQAALPDILTRLQEHKIPVRNQDGLPS